MNDPLTPKEDNDRTQPKIFYIYIYIYIYIKIHTSVTCVVGSNVNSLG
jgi:hypothetical protein